MNLTTETTMPVERQAPFFTPMGNTAAITLAVCTKPYILMTSTFVRKEDRGVICPYFSVAAIVWGALTGV